MYTVELQRHVKR